jgi:hypothetical protein
VRRWRAVLLTPGKSWNRHQEQKQNRLPQNTFVTLDETHRGLLTSDPHFEILTSLAGT